MLSSNPSSVALGDLGDHVSDAVAAQCVHRDAYRRGLLTRFDFNVRYLQSNEERSVQPLTRASLDTEERPIAGFKLRVCAVLCRTLHNVPCNADLAIVTLVVELTEKPYDLQPTRTSLSISCRHRLCYLCSGMAGKFCAFKLCICAELCHSEQDVNCERPPQCRFTLAATRIVGAVDC